MGAEVVHLPALPLVEGAGRRQPGRLGLHLPVEGAQLLAVAGGPLGLVQQAEDRPVGQQQGGGAAQHQPAAHRKAAAHPHKDRQRPQRRRREGQIERRLPRPEPQLPAAGVKAAEGQHQPHLRGIVDEGRDDVGHPMLPGLQLRRRQPAEQRRRLHHPVRAQIAPQIPEGGQQAGLQQRQPGAEHPPGGGVQAELKRRLERKAAAGEPAVEVEQDVGRPPRGHGQPQPRPLPAPMAKDGEKEQQDDAVKQIEQEGQRAPQQLLERHGSSPFPLDAPIIQQTGPKGKSFLGRAGLRLRFTARRPAFTAKRALAGRFCGTIALSKQRGTHRCILSCATTTRPSPGSSAA